MNIPIDISSQASNTISFHKDYVKVIPLTIDGTPLNYISLLPDRKGNNSLNSTIEPPQENLNGTRNLTKQDIQTPSCFVKEEIVETIVATTQQSISPINPNLTTPKTKNPTLPQVTLQSTVKPSVAPKYSHMDYQTYRPMTKPTQKRTTFTETTLQNTIIIMSTIHKLLILPERKSIINSFHKDQNSHKHQTIQEIFITTHILYKIRDQSRYSEQYENYPVLEKHLGQETTHDYGETYNQVSWSYGKSQHKILCLESY